MIDPCPEPRATRSPQLAERRRLIRYALHPPLPCLVLSPGGQLVCMAVAQDLSARGLRLFVRRPFAPGTALTIELGNRTGTLRFPLPAKVDHACEEGGRSHWLGVGVAGLLTAAERPGRVT